MTLLAKVCTFYVHILKALYTCKGFECLLKTVRHCGWGMMQPKKCSFDVCNAYEMLSNVLKSSYSNVKNLDSLKTWGKIIHWQSAVIKWKLNGILLSDRMLAVRWINEWMFSRLNCGNRAGFCGFITAISEGKWAILFSGGTLKKGRRDSPFTHISFRL